MLSYFDLKTVFGNGLKSISDDARNVDTSQTLFANMRMIVHNQLHKTKHDLLLRNPNPDLE